MARSLPNAKLRTIVGFSASFALTRVLLVMLVAGCSLGRGLGAEATGSSSSEVICSVNTPPGTKCTSGSSSGSSSGGTSGSGGGSDPTVGTILASTPVGRIDGAFAVDDDGAATYAIPLRLPDGRAGMRPSLALRYSSHAGNGLLGAGWALDGLSSITRCKRTLAEDGRVAPVRFDATDAFCLDGQRLVPVSGQEGADKTQYRTERESWVLVTSHVASGDTLGPTYWTVQLPNGVTRYYGEGWPGQIVNGADLEGYRAVVQNANGGYASTLARLGWALARTEDRAGNYYDVSYNRSGTGLPGSPLEQHPRLIQYTGLDTTNRSPSVTLTGGSGSPLPARSVAFTYESRPDASDGYTAGLHVATTVRLKRVDAYGPPGYGQTASTVPPTTSYVLTYDNLSPSGASNLVQLQECDRRGVCLPATTFAWQRGAATADFTAQSISFPTPGTFAPSQSAPYRVLDADGDGKADLVAMSPFGSGVASPYQARASATAVSGGCQFSASSISVTFPAFNNVPPSYLTWALYAYQGDGTGSFTPVNSLPGHAAPPNIDRPIDIDNDGRDDLFVDNAYVDTLTCGDTSQAFSEWMGIGVNLFTGQSFWSFDEPFSATDSSYLVDLDGNGVVDLVTQMSSIVGATSTSSTCFLCQLPTVTTTLVPSNTPASVGYWISGTTFNPTQAAGTAPMQGLTIQNGAITPSVVAVHPVDCDGDGTTNLIFQIDGYDASGDSGNYTFQVGSSPPACTVPATGATPTGRAWLPTSYPPGSCQFDVDVNGDGLTDSLRLAITSADVVTAVDVSFNTGAGYLAGTSFPLDGTATLGEGLDCGATNPGVMPIEFLRDGRQDVYLPAANVIAEFAGDHFHVRPLSTPGGMVSYASSHTSWDLTQIADVDGDGLQDIVQADAGTGNLEWLRRSGPTPDLMTGVVDGFGRQVNASYTTLADRNVYTPSFSTGSCAYPVKCLQTDPMPLVAEHDESDGIGGMSRYLYAYSDARADLRGRGWLGFASRTVTDVSTGAVETRTFDNSTSLTAPSSSQPVGADGFSSLPYAYPRARSPQRVTRQLSVAGSGGGVHVTDEAITPEFMYETIAGASGSPLIVRARTAQSSYSESTPAAPTSLTLLSQSTTTYTYDAYGNAYEAFTTDLDQSSYESYSYISNDATDWLLGGVYYRWEVSTTAPTPTAPGVSKTYEHAYDYYPGTLLVYHDTSYDGLGLVTTYGRANVYGVVDSVSKSGTADAQGDVQTRGSATTYDGEWLYPQKTTNALGQPTTWIYEPALGVPVHVTDANGVTRTRLYDGFGRNVGDYEAPGPAENQQYLISATTFAADTGGGPAVLDVTRSTGDGQQTVTKSDMLGRAIAWEAHGLDGALVSNEVGYNALGQLVIESRPHAATAPPAFFTIHYYDGFGRPSQTVYPGQSIQVSSSYGYSAAAGAYQITTTDADGNASTSTIDSNGRVIGVDEGSGATHVAYTYGPFGQPSTATGPWGTTTFTYDAAGRRIGVSDPDRGTRSFAFNAFGEVMESQDSIDAAAGVWELTSRDLLGRPVSRTNRDGQTAWTWDSQPNGVGLLAWSTSPTYGDLSSNAVAVTRRYSYDADERIASDQTTIGAESFGVSYSYDAQGRLSTLTYPSVAGRAPFTVQEGYAPFGQLSSVADVTVPTAPRTLWQARQANPDGSLAYESFYHGLTTEYDYDPVTGRLSGLETYMPAAGTWNQPQQSAETSSAYVQALKYGYDGNGNVLSRTNNHVSPSQQESFTYDSLGRLSTTSVTSQGQVGPGETVVYDPSGSGNISSDGLGTYVYGQNGAGPHAVTTFTVAASGVGESYGYDRNGDQISRPGKTLAYTTFGLPEEIDSPVTLDGKTVPMATSRFAYDAGGQRAARYQVLGSTIYVQELYERFTSSSPGAGAAVTHRFNVEGPAGRIVAEVLWSTTAGGTALPDATQYVHHDRAGSVDVLTGGNGLPLQSFSFDAFGMPRNPNWMIPGAPASSPAPMTPRGYDGLEQDDEAGLVNMRGRMYDPRLRRFLSTDPQVSAGSSQLANPYSYAVNNPATLKDPSGRFPTGGEHGGSPFSPGEPPWWSPSAWVNYAQNVIGNAQAGDLTAMSDTSFGASANDGAELDPGFVPDEAAGPAAAPGQAAGPAAGAAPGAGPDLGSASSTPDGSKSAQLKAGPSSSAGQDGAGDDDDCRENCAIVRGHRDNSNPGLYNLAHALLGIDRHHIFPQQFIDEFREIFEGSAHRLHDYTIPISRELHSLVHGGGWDWNADWDDFLHANDALPDLEQTLEFAGTMMEEYGLWPYLPLVTFVPFVVGGGAAF
jgi:RHS repeat-associated protein